MNGSESKFKRFLNTENRFLLKIAPFICPIMMFLMIPMIIKSNGGNCHK